MSLVDGIGIVVEDADRDGMPARREADFFRQLALHAGCEPVGRGVLVPGVDMAAETDRVLVPEPNFRPPLSPVGEEDAVPRIAGRRMG